jgi:glycosyltransferase involved in cell wall biosynthesis
MSTGLRIAVASCGLGHVARGIEAWAADLAAALHARHENVTLFKGGGVAQLPYEQVLPCWQRDRSPVTQWWFPTRRAWRWGYGSPYMAEQTTFSRALIRHLKQHHYDILHVQDPHVALNVQSAKLKTKVILAHGTEEPLNFITKIDYLQHLAPWHLDQAKAADVWKPEWTAIPNFIDTKLYEPGSSPSLRQELSIPLDAKVFLTAAAIKRNHKRVDYLIDEYARLKNPHHYYIIAGGREAETDEVLAMGKAKLGERVRFLVNHPRARMPELYRAADVFVLGSLFEMMPIALVEACASGRPCVTHEHSVMQWMTGPGGVSVDMSQPGALATILESDLSTLGPLARAHCVANFSTDAVVDRIVDYYCRVARGS